MSRDLAERIDRQLAAARRTHDPMQPNDIPYNVAIAAARAIVRTALLAESTPAAPDEEGLRAALAEVEHDQGLPAVLARLDGPLDWDRDSPEERIDRFIRDVRALARQDKA